MVCFSPSIYPPLTLKLLTPHGSSRWNWCLWAIFCSICTWEYVIGFFGDFWKTVVQGNMSTYIVCHQPWQDVLHSFNNSPCSDETSFLNRCKYCYYTYKIFILFNQMKSISYCCSIFYMMEHSYTSYRNKSYWKVYS